MTRDYRPGVGGFYYFTEDYSDAVLKQGTASGPYSGAIPKSYSWASSGAVSKPYARLYSGIVSEFVVGERVRVTKPHPSVPVGAEGYTKWITEESTEWVESGRYIAVIYVDGCPYYVDTQYVERI